MRRFKHEQGLFYFSFRHFESLDGQPEHAIAFNGTTSLIHGTFNRAINLTIIRIQLLLES